VHKCFCSSLHQHPLHLRVPALEEHLEVDLELPQLRLRVQLLDQLEFSHDPVVTCNGDFDAIKSWSADPTLAEVAHVEQWRVSLDDTDEVVAVGVGPGLRLELLPECVSEAVVTDVVKELFQQRGSFAISDAVERVFSFFGSALLVGYCVSGVQTVSTVRKPLAIGQVEHGSAEVAPPGPPVLSNVGYLGGEGLVEPQIIPPHHGH